VIVSSCINYGPCPCTSRRSGWNKFSAASSRRHCKLARPRLYIIAAIELNGWSSDNSEVWIGSIYHTCNPSSYWSSFIFVGNPLTVNGFCRFVGLSMLFLWSGAGAVSWISAKQASFNTRRLYVIMVLEMSNVVKFNAELTSICWVNWYMFIKECVTRHVKEMESSWGMICLNGIEACCNWVALEFCFSLLTASSIGVFIVHNDMINYVHHTPM